MNNPFETIDKRLSNIENLILDLQPINQPQQPTEKPDFLSEYIAKSEVRGKLASASTLWKYEKEGRLQSYGVGGKRFYKKEDVENLFTKLNKKGGDHV